MGPYADDSGNVIFNKQQADMLVLVIGVLAQMDMVGRQRGLPVKYEMTVARLVGDLAAVFGLEFIQLCQRVMQHAAVEGPQERIVASGNGSG